MFSPLWMKKIRGARANRTGGASIDGYNSQSPREQWRYRLRLLSFFRASAGVAFQPCLCDSQEMRFSIESAGYMYSILDLKLDNWKCEISNFRFVRNTNRSQLAEHS